MGAECAELRHQLDVTYPVSNGIINSWEDMYHIWDHTFYDQLQVDPTECRILLTDPPLNVPARAMTERVRAPERLSGLGRGAAHSRAWPFVRADGVALVEALAVSAVDAADGMYGASSHRLFLASARPFFSAEPWARPFHPLRS